MIEIVQAGYGRSMSRLPAALGVSRQTLDAWLDGTGTPNAEHQRQLEQVVAAAEAFRAADFKLTSAMLDRTLLRGKSFLELMAEDRADGRALAEKLMRVVRRGAQACAQLDLLLGGRKATLTADDFTPVASDSA